MAWASAVDADNGLFRTNHRRSLPCVRVVAGDLRGRRIEAPTSEATRPTTDMVREAVFNALGSLDVVQGARVLDLFAGTGAMGIEAISRGADHCVFVENDRAALAVLRSNIAALGISEKSTVIAGDAVGTSPLANIQGPPPPGSNSPALHVIPPLACSFEMHLATGCALQTTILV